jgi:hypothetical protein
MWILYHGPEPYDEYSLRLRLAAAGFHKSKRPVWGTSTGLDFFDGQFGNQRPCVQQYSGVYDLIRLHHISLVQSSNPPFLAISTSVRNFDIAPFGL